jgi:hypothetical protein
VYEGVSFMNEEQEKQLQAFLRRREITAGVERLAFLFEFFLEKFFIASNKICNKIYTNCLPYLSEV